MIYDPALAPLIPELQAFNAKVGVDPPPPPAGPPPVDYLPATDESLPARPEVKLHILQAAPAGQLRGVYLHCHGGGFKYGAPAMADGNNSELARALSLAVVSVDYRLAPAFTHPAAIDDCEAAALWLLEHCQARFGTRRLLIGGESVGATLAVQTLLRLRDRHQAASVFSGANLVVGGFDFSMTPSQRLSNETLFLNPARLAETREGAFPGRSLDALRSPEYSPLYARLEGLPPAIFSIGTRDSVLDDSLFMSMRWRAAGNRAELQVYPEGTHTFLGGPTGMAREARRRIAEFLRGCL